MEQAYAQAIVKAAERGMAPERAAARLREVLASHGHSKLLPRIANALRARAKEVQAHAPTLRIAKKAQESQARTAAMAYDARAANALVSVDESQIGGWVFEASGTRIDASHKKHLLDLYHRIIA